MKVSSVNTLGLNLNLDLKKETSLRKEENVSAELKDRLTFSEDAAILYNANQKIKSMSDLTEEFSAQRLAKIKENVGRNFYLSEDILTKSVEQMLATAAI